MTPSTLRVALVASLATLGIVTACLESCSGIAELRGGGSGVVYVSFAPGTVRGGATIAIDNLATDLSLTAVLVNGGLDPIAVAARTGDTLKLVVTDSSGASRPPQFLVVAVISPDIVRTDPPPGGTDVALNTQTVVVFSEPMDPQTVTTQTIQVRLNGQPLPGTAILSPDGLLGEFRPAAPLLPHTAYTLVVTSGVADVRGLRLAQQAMVNFTTGGGAGQIAFVSNRTGKAQIYVMAPDGTRPTQLTYDTAGAGGPSWSADGTRMSFVRHGNLYVMNADGTGVVHLFADQQSDGAATWSPDGTRLAFERCCDGLGYSQIYIVNSDGSGLVPLTTDPRFHESPAWSPDGSRIAYHAFAGVAAGQEFPDIYVIHVDGAGLTDLTPNSPTQDMYPAWSPDGRKIAFASHRSGGMQIFVMNADGTGVVNLTNDSTAVVFSPTWSPSGLRIAFMGHANGIEEIFVMSADGSGIVNVTNNPAGAEDPQWSPP